MDFTKATDNQLQNIVRFDKECPVHLLNGVVTEMINRNLFKGLMKKVIMKRFSQIDIAVKILQTEEEDLFQYCQMKIFESLKLYKPGMQSFVYFAFLYLKSQLSHLESHVKAKKRKIYENQVSFESESEQITNICPSSTNVERTVINKITIENCWGVLRDIEKMAIILDQQGYEQCEIAEMFGYGNKRSGHTLIHRAYAKLRKQMGA